MGNLLWKERSNASRPLSAPGPSHAPSQRDPSHRLDPADREAVRGVIRALDTLTLEAGRCWREIGEPPAVAEARAAAVDLRYVQAFLARLVEEGRGADPGEEPERTRIAGADGRLAPAVGRIAAALEGTLADQPGKERPSRATA